MGVLLTYADGPLTGRVAASRRLVGDGAAWYLGTLPDDATLGMLLDDLVDRAGVTPVASVPPGVDVVRRRGPAGSWLFVINHTEEPCHIDVLGYDLVAGAPVGPTTTVPARRAAVIRES